jgi:hypothetical protein
MARSCHYFGACAGATAPGTRRPPPDLPGAPRNDVPDAHRLASYDLHVSTFLNTLHVVLAVLVIGPLVVAPFAARRAITSRNADGVRFAANQVALFGAGTMLVAGFGVATVLTGDEWTMITPWVLIASTLFVVALGLIFGYAVPALRRAASLVGAGATDQHAAVAAAQPEGSGQATGSVEPSDSGADLSDEELSEADTVPTPVAPDGSFVTTADLAAKERLDSLSARITGAGWLLLVTFTAITVLMTVRPFS